MGTFVDLLGSVNNVVWGPLMLIMIVGTGLYLTIGLKIMPWRKIGYAFRLMWKGRKHEEGAKGELTPFNSLMTALAATVGTGNIAGVATAIYMGGPGAVFWMWMTAMVGMATKFAESVLAVKYRERTPEGHYAGGAMYFIKNGLGKNWVWLGTSFAVFGAVAGFGIGNMVQSNSIVEAIIPVPFGVVSELDTVWLIADTLNAMMAVPNLIGVAMLSPVLFRITTAYFKQEAIEEGSSTH